MSAAPLYSTGPQSITHYTRYIREDGTLAYVASGLEEYVKDTLPHEWPLSNVSPDALQAGAVIIRSGVYWRVNRSFLGATFPNNNCYEGESGGHIWYRTAPNTRFYDGKKGQEEFHPNSGDPLTDAAVDATFQYHGELLSRPTNRPDPFVGLRYAAQTITLATVNAEGDWLERIESAYSAAPRGSDYNPNSECSQVDEFTDLQFVQWGPNSCPAFLVAELEAAATSCAERPVATTEAATNITQESALLNLTVNSGGASTYVWFDWGTTPSLGKETTPHRNIGTGTSPIPVSITLGGLTCDKTYYFQARAENASGDAPPAQTRSFKTDPCDAPTSDTTNLVRNGDFGDDDDFWTLFGNFHANDDFNNHHDSRGYAYLSRSDGSPGNGLLGTIYQQVTIPANADSAVLTYWTYISTNEPSGGPAEDFLNVTLKDSSGDFLDSLQLLSNRNVSSGYVKREFNLEDHIGDTIRIHFLGTTNNDSQPTIFRIDDVSLRVQISQGDEPDVTTLAADQVRTTSARLNMSVDPNRADTEVWFDLEPGDPTPNTDTEHIQIGGGSGSRDVRISVFGLECGTKYYFEAHARNTHGLDTGIVRNFTTAACSGGRPHADTDPAMDITKTSATLTADVDANGLSTKAWFAWDDSPNLGSETSHVSVGSDVGEVDFSQTLTGLSCGLTYYFENHASNSAGEDDGVTLSFRTLDCDAPTQSADLLLFVSRQACSGLEPAVLFGWTMPEGADPIVTLRRLDGHYGATINTAVKGPAHEVDKELAFGNVYRFRAEAQVNGETLTSNEVAVSISSDECRLPVIEGDLPHRPILRARPALCENGVAKVTLEWTEAAGAQSYSLHRGGHSMPSATYNDLTGTSFIDSGLTPGGGAQYGLTAHNANGSVSSWNVGVIVPGTVCSTAGAPGSFSASVEDLVCDENLGAVTVRWNQSAGAAADYRVFEFFDHSLARVADHEDDFADQRRHLDPGIAMRAVVQAQSATTPGKFREAYPVAQLIPIDVCSASTVLPAVGSESASYVRTSQALLKASVIANGSPTTAHYEWGTSTTYDRRTPNRVIGDSFGSITLGEVLADLSCGTTHHYRVVATNGNGTTEGDDHTFDTDACAPLPVVTVSALDASVSEADLSTGTFRVTRTGDTTAPLTLSHSLGGNAINGADYNALPTQLVTPAGSTFVDVTVTPIQDSLEEPEEAIILTVDPQSHYTVGVPNSATAILSSDDEPCRVTIIQPTAGDVWTKGTPQTIRWTASSGCASFLVSLLRSGKFDALITRLTISGTEFVWTPPAWLVTGPDHQIEVVGFDADGSGSTETTDISDIFSLANPSALPTVILHDAVEDNDSVHWSSVGCGVIADSTTAHSAPEFRACIPGFNGPDYSDLQSPYIDMSGRSSLFLSFWHRLALTNGFSAEVQVSVVPAEWYVVRRLSSTSSWQPVSIDLTRFLGWQSVQIRFYMAGTGSTSQLYWFLDDITIYAPPATSFYTLTPCRAIDTRQGLGSLLPGVLRSFSLVDVCDVPHTARAVSLNITAANPTGTGHLTVFPSDQLQSSTSTLNFRAGQTRANNAVLNLSMDGRLSTIATIGGGQADVILDVNGYFAEPHPLTGVWRGSVTGQTVELDLGQILGLFSAWMSSEGQTAEQLEVFIASASEFNAYSLGRHAGLSLFVNQSGNQRCLSGQYITDGSSEQVSFCRVQ